MTQGTVRDLQARVPVTFRLPGRPNLAVECVVDTGFAGALTLSPEAIEALGLPFFQEIEANLANDSDVRTAVHTATIIWDGRELKWRYLLWDAARSSEPLFSMEDACAWILWKKAKWSIETLGVA